MAEELNTATQESVEKEGTEKKLLSRERYYALKHFCMHYIDWKTELHLISYTGYSGYMYQRDKYTKYFDPVPRLVDKKEKYQYWVNLIDNLAKEITPVYAEHLIRSVTENTSYIYMVRKMGLKLSKKEFYDLYRDFFNKLDEAKPFSMGKGDR